MLSDGIKVFLDRLSHCSNFSVLLVSWFSAPFIGIVTLLLFFHFWISLLTKNFSPVAPGFHCTSNPGSSGLLGSSIPYDFTFYTVWGPMSVGLILLQRSSFLLSLASPRKSSSSLPATHVLEEYFLPSRQWNYFLKLGHPSPSWQKYGFCSDMYSSLLPSQLGSCIREEGISCTTGGCCACYTYQCACF